MSAARAVEEALTARGHDAKTVDVLDHTGRGFRGWYRGGYEVLVKKSPKTWGHLYKSSDRRLFNYGVQTALDLTFVSKMRSYLLSERPDWVLCTHSLPQPSLAHWRRKGRFRVGVVVTDLYPQLMWLRGKPDWFFVPGEWSQEILAPRYPRSVGRTTVTGIPVSGEFGKTVPKRDARKELGLDPDVATVLVTSGGIGGGPIEGAVSSLAQLPSPAQVEVVCGRNVRAFEAASGAAGSPSVGVGLHVHGHVDSHVMALLMHASDLIVAKPGGITTFEALAARLPFVVYDPFLIPGQEEQNRRFLVESGIGERARDSAELKAIVARLLTCPEALESMARCAASQARPDAAELIARQLETLSP